MAALLKTDPFGESVAEFPEDELLELSAWTEERVMLFHYRDRDKLEVDFIVEKSAGEIAGIEVKSPRRSRGAISWDWNAWSALLDLHLCRGLFCMMAFKRSRSPTIFVRSPYRRYGPDGPLFRRRSVALGGVRLRPRRFARKPTFAPGAYPPMPWALAVQT
jgi:hypothetical protein